MIKILIRLQNLLAILGVSVLLTDPVLAGPMVPAKGGAAAAHTSRVINEDGTVSITASGSGHGTHYGAYTSEAAYSGYVTEDESGKWIAIISGSLIVTTANGDQVWWDTFAIECLDSWTFEGEFWQTGGTGRFENGSGYGRFQGDSVPGAFTYTYSGSISSIGANKK
jgi:hypothetical protein